MFIKCHGAYLGSTGFNNHTRGFFRGLSNHAKVYVRNFTLDPKLDSYLNDLDKQILSEQTLWSHYKNNKIWSDYPLPWNSTVLDTHIGEKIHLISAEHNHLYFYDEYYGPKIAFTMWESDRYDVNFLNKLKTYDSNIVLTKWQKECLIQQGLDESKIDIVHEGIDPDCFPIQQEKSDKFKFFLVGTWGFRKSTKEIIECFIKTFERVDDVELHVSVDKHYPIWIPASERFKKHNLYSPKIIVHNFPDRNVYLNLLKNCHVFLSCSRGEGWNIPLAEAFACGIPSIYSKGSGQVEFAGEYPLGVDIQKKVPAYSEEDEYFSDGYLDEPDFKMLSEVIMDSYKNYSTYKKIHLEKSQKFITNYSWNKVSRDLYDIINKRYGSTSLSNTGYVKFHRFSENHNFVFFSQDYFDSCKVYLEIKNEKGDVCFFDDLTMVKNVEYWFGAEFNGKKTFTIYNLNKTIVLFQTNSI
jgi:glycosyltransferase involved in cell wall biosynthesis